MTVSSCRSQAASAASPLGSAGPSGVPASNKCVVILIRNKRLPELDKDTHVVILVRNKRLPQLDKDTHVVILVRNLDATRTTAGAATPVHLGDPDALVEVRQLGQDVGVVATGARAVDVSHVRIPVITWAPECGGRRWGFKGTRLAESERGVWFSWKRYTVSVHPISIESTSAFFFSGGGKRFCKPRILILRGDPGTK